MIALPSALQALDQLDFANPKFYSGYIMSENHRKLPRRFSGIRTVQVERAN